MGVTFMRIIAAIALFCLAAGAQALQLVPGSSEVHFVSVKKGTVGEVHSFRQLSGSVDDNGQVDLSIDLGSVDTGIAIRDTRMKQFLFETDQYPQAVFSATVDIKRARSLKPGQSYDADVSGELNLHGMSADIKAAVRVVALTGNRLLVYTRQPIVLNATDFDLVDGIEKLQQLAGLPNIDHVIPVTFSVVFQ